MLRQFIAVFSCKKEALMKYETAKSCRTVIDGMDGKRNCKNQLTSKRIKGIMLLL